MINKKYAVAMTELLYFLKGFSKEELEKIPSSLLEFFEENCDKEYECKFDYNDDLDKLKLKNVNDKIRMYKKSNLKMYKIVHR